MLSETIIAAVAIAAFILSLFQELRYRRLDREELSFTASVVYDVSASDIPRGDKLVSASEIGGEPLLRFRLLNRGARGIRVESFGGDNMGDAPHFVVEPQRVGLPRTLQRGEWHAFNLPAKLLADEHRVTAFRVHDSFDRPWMLPHPDFLRLQSEARAALTEWATKQAARRSG